jgi:hypothetical protein
MTALGMPTSTSWPCYLSPATQQPSIPAAPLPHTRLGRPQSHQQTSRPHSMPCCFPRLIHRHQYSLVTRFANSQPRSPRLYSKYSLPSRPRKTLYRWSSCRTFSRRRCLCLIPLCLGAIGYRLLRRFNLGFPGRITLMVLCEDKNSRCSFKVDCFDIYCDYGAFLGNNFCGTYFWD